MHEAARLDSYPPGSMSTLQHWEEILEAAIKLPGGTGGFDAGASDDVGYDNRPDLRTRSKASADGRMNAGKVADRGGSAGEGRSAVGADPSLIVAARRERALADSLDAWHEAADAVEGE